MPKGKGYKFGSPASKARAKKIRDSEKEFIAKAEKLKRKAKKGKK